MAKFVGGPAQAGYVDRVRGLDPARCLVAPVDVGKRTALAMIADHHGEVVGERIEFDLTRSGTDQRFTGSRFVKPGVRGWYTTQPLRRTSSRCPW